MLSQRRALSPTLFGAGADSDGKGVGNAGLAADASAVTVEGGGDRCCRR